MFVLDDFGANRDEIAFLRQPHAGGFLLGYEVRNHPVDIASRSDSD